MAKISNVRTGEGAIEVTPALKPAANGVLYVVDAKGRKIGLKKPSPGDRFELDDAIQTNTQAAALTVSVVGCMVSIDDEGYPALWTYEKPRVEFKKRLGDLGDEGLSAITGPVLKMFGIDVDEAMARRAKN